MPSSKPRPAEVAFEARKHYIPTIQNEYAQQWPTYSYLFQKPMEQIPLSPLGPALPPNPDFCEFLLVSKVEGNNLTWLRKMYVPGTLSTLPLIGKRGFRFAYHSSA